MVVPSIRKSIRAAFCFALLSVSVLIGGLIFLSGLSALQVSYEKSVEIGRAQIEESVSAQLASNTTLLTETLARNLRDPLYLYDFSRIRSILLEVSESNSVVYVYLTDKDGNLVHDGTRAIERFGTPIGSVLNTRITNSGEPVIDAEEGVVHVHTDVSAGGSAIGHLYIGMADTVAKRQVDYFSDVLFEGQRSNHRDLLVALAIVVGILLLACLPLAVWLSQKLLTPLYELGSRSRRYAQGEKNIGFSLDRTDEIGSLGFALDDMVSKLSESHEEVWRLAYTDVLTGLPNRRQFHERLDGIIEKADSEARNFAMLFIDLDFFKQVNDAFGHDTGDELLIMMAEKLKSNIEEYLSQHSEFGDRSLCY